MRLGLSSYCKIIKKSESLVLQCSVSEPDTAWQSEKPLYISDNVSPGHVDFEDTRLRMVGVRVESKQLDDSPRFLD